VRFLVDANVLSESVKPNPDRHVLDWMRRHEAELAIDSVVLGEVLYGVLRLPRGRKRDLLERWFEHIVSRVVCLPWTAAIGERWAHLLVSLRNKGLNTPVTDTMIAATALVHDLVIATRNVRDFNSTGVRIVNPFDT
jgi:predicted nucleic acid-binding protein